MDLEILTEELIFFELTYELIEPEKAKIKDEDLFKNKSGELTKLSRLRHIFYNLRQIFHKNYCVGGQKFHLKNVTNIWKHTVYKL